MNKYFQIFKISLEQEFAYRLNFIMWRVRNILQIFLVFFLWDAVFTNPGRVIFGYDKARILTYVFLLLAVRAFVTSNRSVDVAGEISQGTLTNYLLKPVSYFKYWFTRDIASKALNLFFVVFEVTILYFFLKPPIFIQADFLIFASSIAFLILALIIFFLIMSIFNLFPLWFPEQAWGATFLLLIFVDFLGGGIFPLDILPASIVRFLYLTPFPFMLFVPIEAYLGKFDLLTIFRFLLVGVFWVIALTFVLKKGWAMGLKEYRSEGR